MQSESCEPGGTRGLQLSSLWLKQWTAVYKTCLFEQISQKLLSAKASIAARNYNSLVLGMLYLDNSPFDTFHCLIIQPTFKT